MGIQRWFGKGKGDNDGQHEEQTLLTWQPPEHFLVVIEGEGVSEDDETTLIDLPLTVPLASINHVTYVLALNGIPHRVEPLG